MFNQQMHKIFVTHVTPACIISYIQLAVTLGYEQLADDNALVSTHVGVTGNK